MRQDFEGGRILRCGEILRKYGTQAIPTYRVCRLYDNKTFYRQFILVNSSDDTYEEINLVGELDKEVSMQL